MQKVLNNIKRNYLLTIIVIGLIVVSLYSTFAMFTASVNTSDIVDLTASTLPTDTEIVEYERITLGKKQTKTVEFTVKNSTSKSLYYGAWYEMVNPTSINDKIQIAKKEDTTNNTTGQLTAGSTAKVSLVLENKTDSSIIVNIGVAYSLTLSFNLPTNRYLITSAYFPPDITINTNSVSLFNTKGNYDVSLDCTNAKVRWDYTNWKLIVSSLHGSTCDINITSRKDNLAQYIISKSGTTQGTGQIVKENGYRYEGKDPNNYVLFNNELWRIIGVFDSSTHGQSGNLTKIIRNDSIGSYAWHKSNTNDWSAASLKTILNDYYYNSENGNGQTACYFYSTTVPGNCNFTETGLDATARSMIQSVTWKLGGYSSASATASTFYSAERGTTVYSGRPTTATGYIGLMYPSDYGYSVLASSCARTTNLGSYSKSTCGGQSWLLKNGYEWTMTPRSSSSSNVFDVSSNANLYNYYASIGNAVRPVAYLKSSVYIIGGDGSQNNPYVLTSDTPSLIPPIVSPGN